MRWLTTSIKGNQQLYQAVNTAKSVTYTLSGMHGSGTLSWDAFFALLLDQAIIMDSNAPQQRPGKANKA